MRTDGRVVSDGDLPQRVLRVSFAPSLSVDRNDTDADDIDAVEA